MRAGFLWLNTTLNIASQYEPYELQQRLAQQQDFDGSFALTSQFAAIVGVPLDVLLRIAAAEPFISNDAVFATSLAIAVFENKLAHLRDEWELVVAKARKWLASYATSCSVDALIGTAAAAL